MITNVIDRPTDTQLDLSCMPAYMLLEHNYFATTPMLAMIPACSPTTTDEEAYTSFEQAISGRVAQVSRQLNSLSQVSQMSDLPRRHVQTERQVHALVKHFWFRQKHTLMMICMALNLVMCGFDLMGLLLLHSR